MAIRLYEAADEVFQAAVLTLYWTLFTLAGGVLLGVGPATLAAYAVARREITFRAFATAYRREFRRGHLLVLPPLAAAALLTVNLFWFASLGAAGTLPRLVTLAALAAVAVITAYLLPMAAHYDLRTPAYLPTASLFALTRPPASALILVLLTAFAYAVTTYPVLVVVAVGGWIRLSTWLCSRLFAENEARLTAKGFS